MNPIMMQGFFDELQKIAAEEKKLMSPLKSTLLGLGLGLGGGALIGGVHGALSGAAKGRHRAAKALEMDLARTDMKYLPQLYIWPEVTTRPALRQRMLAKEREIAARLPDELATARRLRNRVPNIEEKVRRHEVLQRQLAKEQKIEALPSIYPRQAEEKSERLFQARLARQKAEAAAIRADEGPIGLKRKLERQIQRIERSKDVKERLEDLERAKAQILSAAPQSEAVLARRGLIKGMQSGLLGGAAIGAMPGAGAGLTTGLLRRKKDQNAP